VEIEISIPKGVPPQSLIPIELMQYTVSGENSCDDSWHAYGGKMNSIETTIVSNWGGNIVGITGSMHREATYFMFSLNGKILCEANLTSEYTWRYYGEVVCPLSEPIEVRYGDVFGIECHAKASNDGLEHCHPWVNAEVINPDIQLKNLREKQLQVGLGRADKLFHGAFQEYLNTRSRKLPSSPCMRVWDEKTERMPRDCQKPMLHGLYDVLPKQKPDSDTELG